MGIVDEEEAMEKRERDVEAWLRRQIERLGGKAMKFVSPGNNGVPDRIAILPGGKVWFIELKKRGEKQSELQKWQAEQLRKLGCNVATVAGMEQAQAWIEEVMLHEVHTT